MLSNQTLLVKSILIDAIKVGAADLHFSVGKKPAYKINNQWITMDDREMVDESFIQDLTKTILDEAGQAKLEKEKEIFFSYDFDKDLRFKINIFYQKRFLSVTLRHIPAKIPTIDSLGLNPVVKKLVDFKKGLVLIAGAFGSGKSSTAAAMIEEINQRKKQYIITIEQPIEYIFANNESIVEQREVGIDTASFEDALKYFQEEAGDVLFLENVSDIKFWPIILEIASGSSLVITTCNADTVTGAISTIINGFTSFDQERIRDMMSIALKAVVCQKILPKVGGGSVAAQEILIVNDAAKSLIAKGSINQIDNIIQVSRKDGMVTFDQALVDLAKNKK